MDLTQLANLGEFIGGVAVLVTLIYLAVQVRHGRNELRLGSDLDLSGRIAHLAFSYAQDPALARALELALRSPEDLDDDGVRRAHWIFTGYFHMIEALYLRSLEGAVSEESWSAQENIVTGLIRSRFGRALWASRQQFAFSQPFQSFVEGRIREPDGGTYWDVVPPEEFIRLLGAVDQEEGPST